MRDSVKIVIACIVCLGVVGAAGVYVWFSRNNNNKDRKVVTRPYGDVVQWKYEDEDDTKWRELINLDVIKVDGQTPDMDVADGWIRYKNSEGEWVNLMPLDSLAGSQGSAGLPGQQGAQGTQGLQGPPGEKGEKGADGREVEFRSSGGFIQWKYAGTGDSEWRNLVAVASLSGVNGKDGRSVEVRNTGTAIAWRYEGEPDAAWRPIMSLAALKGEVGPTGIPGIQGEQGEQGPTGEPGEQGPSGKDGREVEIQKTESEIQWRYDGEEQWNTLVALSALTGKQGESGKNIELKGEKSGNDYILKYRVAGSGDDYEPLFTISGAEIKGEPGRDGRDIELTLMPKVAAKYDDDGNKIAEEQPEAIKWRYTTGDDTEWKSLIETSKLKGADGTITGGISLRVVKDVEVIDDDTTDPPTTHKEDQVQWINKENPTDEDEADWKKLCLVEDLKIDWPDPEEKDAKTQNDTSDLTLDSTKKYLVTIVLSYSNSTDDIVQASVSCDGGSVQGTWLAQDVKDDGETETTTPFTASYSTSFTVTGKDTLSFTTSDDISTVSVTISYVEI